MDYKIDAVRRLVLSTGRGHVTFADAKAHQEQLLSDPEFDPSFNQLVDVTEVTNLDLSNREIEALGFMHIFSTDAKIAYVADNPFMFGLGRLMQAHHEMSGGGAQTHVFHDLESAKKWLGL